LLAERWHREKKETAGDATHVGGLLSPCVNYRLGLPVAGIPDHDFSDEMFLQSETQAGNVLGEKLRASAIPGRSGPQVEGLGEHHEILSLPLVIEYRGQDRGCGSRLFVHALQRAAQKGRRVRDDEVFPAHGDGQRPKPVKHAVAGNGFPFDAQLAGGESGANEIHQSGMYRGLLPIGCSQESDSE